MSAQGVRTAGLDVATIVAAALELADRDGIDRLSMRRVSAALDVTPMALYHHVAGKDELLDLVVDEALRDVPALDHDAAPVDGVVTVLLALHRLLVAHPALAHATGERPLEGPVAARLAHDVLAALRRAGLSEEEAGERLVALFALAVGMARYRGTRGSERRTGPVAPGSDLASLAPVLDAVVADDAATERALRRLLGDLEGTA